MSHSTFSPVPSDASPSVVRSRVSGIRDTSIQSSPSAAKVRLTPSSAIDPFSTTYRISSGPSATRRRRAKPSSAVESNLADSVDMALQNVPAEPIRRLHRQLQVDPIARSQAAQGGHLQRLVHRLGLEPAGVGLRRGQAGPVDRDRVAGRDLRPQIRGEPQPSAIGPGLDGLHSSDVLNQTGEHHHSLNRAVIRVSPEPSSAGVRFAPPSRTGATKVRASSTSPASTKAAARVWPPSKNEAGDARGAPRAARAVRMSSATTISAPASRKGLGVGFRGDDDENRRLVEGPKELRVER